eukprot:758449-Hanusia_phi.AAC.1
MVIKFRSQVPHAHAAVPGGGEDDAAVKQEEIVDTMGVRFDLLQQRSALDAPEAYGLIKRSGQEHVVDYEQRADISLMGMFQRLHLPLFLRIPH